MLKQYTRIGATAVALVAAGAAALAPAAQAAPENPKCHVDFVQSPPAGYTGIWWDALTLKWEGTGNAYSSSNRGGWRFVTGAGVLGTTGNDIISGSNGADTIAGAAGDDKLCGWGGSDNLRGEAGNDLIYGGEGDDSIRGGDGNDYLLGGPGTDEIGGGAGDDKIDGGPGSDKLTGGEGDDLISNYDASDSQVAGAEGVSTTSSSTTGASYFDETLPTYCSGGC